MTLDRDIDVNTSHVVRHARALLVQNVYERQTPRSMLELSQAWSPLLSEAVVQTRRPAESQ